MISASSSRATRSERAVLPAPVHPTMARKSGRRPGDGRARLSGEADPAGVEAVGLDYVRADVEKGVVDVGNGVRQGQVQQVVIALHVLRPVGEARAAVARPGPRPPRRPGPRRAPPQHHLR